MSNIRLPCEHLETTAAVAAAVGDDGSVTGTSRTLGCCVAVEHDKLICARVVDYFCWCAADTDAAAVSTTKNLKLFSR